MPTNSQIKERLHRRGICIIIPTYNNAGTLRQVVTDVLEYCGDVFVVNDGSTDGTMEILGEFSEIRVICYGKNRGKGYALKKGFMAARKAGFAYAITMDSDGQHYAGDIPLFLEANIRNPGCLIVGARNLDRVKRSKGSNFANRFSNFWFMVQTGKRLPDTQTGYRLYPLKHVLGLGVLTTRYEAELELLVIASWHGTKILSIPVNVYYPPMEERISHFRPVWDFTRISILNTILCVLTLVYALPLYLLRQLFKGFATVYSAIFFFCVSVLFATPVAWLILHVGKTTEEKKSRLHRLMYHIARMIMIHHGVPGAKFSFSLDPTVDFSKPSLIICNHQSHLDLMCQMIFTHKVIFLTNDWAWHNKFYGKLIHMAEYIPVSSGIDELLPKLKDLVSRGYHIALYPEGTRSTDCRIGRFHKGCFYIADQLGMDIIPMCIYGTGKVLPKHGRCMRKGHIHIDVGAPVTVSQQKELEGMLERSKFARRKCIEKYDELADRIEQNA